MKNLANAVGVRPPRLAALGDCERFLGEETELRGEFTFPENEKEKYILRLLSEIMFKYGYSTYWEMIDHSEGHTFK